MEGSENVKSNLSFSEESEQDLYGGSLRRKGVRSVYLGTPTWNRFPSRGNCLSELIIS